MVLVQYFQGKLDMICRLSAPGVVVVLLAACSSATGNPTAPPPTVSLIPQTATFTALPPTPTPTPEPSPTNPLDVLPTQSALPAPGHISLEVEAVIDAVLTDAVSFFNTDHASLQILSIKSVRWRYPVLSCQNMEIRASALLTPLLEGESGYRLIVSDSESAVVYLATAAGEVLPCEELPLLDTYGNPIMIDPLANELIVLARNALAQRLNTSPGHIEIADVLSLDWTDTSLGCPVESENYNVQSTPGLRILMEYQGSFYAYHADFVSVYACPLESERLPRPFAPTPTPTATFTPAP